MKTALNVHSLSLPKRADIGAYKIDRVLPNRYVEAIGPFVFLDHLLPSKHDEKSLQEKPEGTGPHPHRGIATLTYVLNGQAEHYDSKGHHAKVNSGGVQWMKAGDGIVHDESIRADPNTNDFITHSFQFWIDLPAKNKKEQAEYIAMQSEEVPKAVFDKNRGWLKVIAGTYETLKSSIPSYSTQFIYHLHLEGNNGFVLDAIKECEYAAFFLDNAVINNIDYHNGELITFEQDNGVIEIKNVSTAPIDIILFGGEPYDEPIVASGPFVMNTQHEISVAYNDYYEGKYGEIVYDNRE